MATIAFGWTEKYRRRELQ